MTSKKMRELLLAKIAQYRCAGHGMAVIALTEFGKDTKLITDNDVASAAAGKRVVLFTPLDDFEKKFEEAFFLNSISRQFSGKDGFDVEFDFENCNLRDDPTSFPRDLMGKGLMGYQTLENGLQFLGGCAGGDWQVPVYFIVFWDGERFRPYVPRDGNVFNKDTNEAFGNEPEKDFDYFVKNDPAFKAEEFDREDFEADGDFEPEKIKKELLDLFQPTTAPIV
jgi:hypothetical protein